MTAGTPFRTIGKALETARHGSRIHVETGQYARADGNDPGETFPLTVEDLIGIEILGAGAEASVIDASGSGTRVLSLLNAHRVRIKAVTLTGGETFFGGGLAVENCQDLWLVACTIADNTFSASETFRCDAAGIHAASSDVTLIDCIVRDNTGVNGRNHSQSIARGGGIWSDGILRIRETVIAGNTVSSEPNSAVRAWGGGVALWPPSPRVQFRNVLIHHNAATGYGDGVFVRGGSVALENMTIADNDGEGIGRQAGSVVVYNGILWDNGVDISDAGPETEAHFSNIGTGSYVDQGGNISTDPFFVDAPAGNYRLQTQYGRRDTETDPWIHDAQTSPCIDAGTNLAWHDGAVDLDGAPRRQRGRYETVGLIVDMGAYEQTSRPRGTVLLFR